MDWKEKDDLKKKKVDRNFVSCTEAYELAEVIGEVHALRPEADIKDIATAVTKCCAEVEAPRPRKEFVVCVLKKIDA